MKLLDKILFKISNFIDIFNMDNDMFFTEIIGTDTGIVPFNFKSLDIISIANIMRLVSSVPDSNGIIFKSGECRVGKIYNPKIEKEIKQRKNKVLLFVKVYCDISVKPYRTISSRHIFYTLDNEGNPIKVSIESISKFKNNDNSLDELFMAVNGYYAQGIIKVSNLKTFTPYDLTIPVSYNNLDIMSKKKFTGYMHVIGSKQTFIDADIAADEPYDSYDGYFHDDEMLHEDIEKEIDLENCDYPNGKIIPINKVIRERMALK